jgi:hypothetical protein
MMQSKTHLSHTILAVMFFGLTLAAWTVPQPVMAQGTPEQQQACTGDAMRLCSHTIPDPGRTKACLIGNRRSLSAPCRTVFAGGKVIKRKAKRSRRG